MKTPLWFPQSFFARTLWLVLIVVLFSKALTLVYLLMNEDVIVDRQYSHGAALTIRAFWAADEESRAAIAKASGLRWVPSSADQPGEQHWPYTEIFQRQMQMELGPDTETRLRIHQPSQLWVRAPSLSQPLKRLVVAARQFGQGRSVRLPLGPETPSEMAEVYRAFNQMAEDIEQGGRERELMLAGVSHDLRTPLTRLRLSLELLPESEREMVEDMIRDIEDMDAILDQFLAFIRDGRDEPVEEGDLTDLVREVVAPFNQTREQVRMALQPVPAMPLRRVSMKRLLGNLIDNALNHGGGSVEVASYVAGESAAPYVVLSVLDRGQGIDPAEVDSIFNPFIRGDKARGGKGTGLGLAIVKRIAAQHGGSVELRNRDGGGLEARVCLPLGLLLPRGAA